MKRLHFDCQFRRPDGFELSVAFDAGPGVTALFGPSGAGKSTTLALTAGLLRPRRGTIRLDDVPLVDTGAGVFVPPHRRRIGVVFQDHLLFPHLTVRQNLLFGHRRHADRDIDLDSVAALLELGGLLGRRPHALSGGQRQRVALGRALLTGPGLLLMDEPLAALDTPLKDRILSYLERAVAAWHIPTLFVSHDQADVRRLADHVVVIEGGRVLASGPTAGTLDNALLTRMRQPRPPVNLLRVSGITRAGDHAAGEVSGQKLRLPGPLPDPLPPDLHVQFLPGDVILAVTPPTGLSARNCLAGRVRELLRFPDCVFVAVDAGQFLWSQVTPEAAAELGLEPGKPVICVIKTGSLTVV